MKKNNKIRTIRVETNDSEIPHEWRVYVDDEDISDIISGITIKGIVGEFAEVRLDCVARVELPDALKAHVEVVEAG